MSRILAKRFFKTDTGEIFRSNNDSLHSCNPSPPLMPGCSLVLVCHVSVARDNQLDRAAGGRPQHSIEAFAERRAPIHLNDLGSPFSTLPLSCLSCRMILSIYVSPLS